MSYVCYKLLRNFLPPPNPPVSRRKCWEAETAGFCWHLILRPVPSLCHTHACAHAHTQTDKALRQTAVWRWHPRDRAPGRGSCQWSTMTAVKYNPDNLCSAHATVVPWFQAAAPSRVHAESSASTGKHINCHRSITEESKWNFCFT